MRDLVIAKLKDAVNDGWDLSDLEFNDAVAVEDLDTLTDEILLSIYSELVGFNG